MSPNTTPSAPSIRALWVAVRRRGRTAARLSASGWVDTRQRPQDMVDLTVRAGLAEVASDDVLQALAVVGTDLVKRLIQDHTARHADRPPDDAGEHKPGPDTSD